MKLRLISLAALAVASGISSAALAQSRSTYIVQLAAEPVASYTGNVAGYAATQPTLGSRLNVRSAAAVSYGKYLEQQQLQVAQVVGNAPVIARYKTVFNGFAAQLTQAEVAALRANPLVVSVTPDEARKLETISTARFLELTAPGGLWSQMVGGLPVKGEDIIIGIVDSGIWPENPTYADRVDANGTPTFSGGTLAYGPPPAGWSGSCQAGEGGAEGFNPAVHCNNKLIGAQFFNAGFKANRPATGTNSKHWTEFYSPRDSVAGATGHGGHGSHTSSTAGGNAGPLVSIGGISLGATAAGMAPRARIASYKVCFTYVNPSATDGSGSQNSCYTSDSVAAIDKAVADGVHVINFSISGSQTSVNDPVEQAFLRASNAGVFVAASAGNSGPANAVAHISPWLTTVAASTHDRAPVGTVTLGNGASYSGASFSPYALPQTSVIRAEDAGLPGADANLNLCFSSPNQLDPAKVAGKVVVCTRGVNARVDKSLAVMNAGGVGMVLVDTANGLVADVHSVPTVHVSAADGAAIKTYAQAAGATAAISQFNMASKPAPIMASFSSRGPNMGDPNILKPDLTAPGVDVIAAVTADLTQAQRDAVANGSFVPQADWASYQGTSMSSPHVAGLGALLRQAHPTWSPAAIKSALMTTAYSTLNDGLAGAQNGQLPWAQGAGHVAPNKAFDPGLVYDAGRVDWIRYQCKVNRAAVSNADCTTHGTLDETYNLNLPSITVGSVQGFTTVTRRVTNVGSAPATYTASVSLPAGGFTAQVSPSTLSLAPGETKSFTVKFTNAGAAENVWTFGALTWTDGSHVVRSPVSLRAGKAISSPIETTGTTVSGTRILAVKTGFSGRMGLAKGGMKAVTLSPEVTLTAGTESSNSLRTKCIAGVDTANVKVYPVSIPAGTIVARFELRNADTGVPGADDFDLMLLSPTNVATYSGNDASNEAVQVLNPAAGNYKVCVVAYGSYGPGANGSSMRHKLSSWVVTTGDASSSLNVAGPSSVTAGGTASVGVAWSGLATGGRYLGGVQFLDGSGVVSAATAVRVNTSGEPVVTVNPDAMPEKILRPR